MDATVDTLKIEIISDAGDAESGLNSLLSTLSKIKKTTSGSNTSSQKANSRLTSIKSTLSKVGRTLKTVTNRCAEWFSESNDYIEALNLFHVSMGDAAGSAREYAESLQDLLGIDLKEWMNYQGSFNQLFEGFGIDDDKAAKMSQQLTQLTYDLSSYANIDVSTAFKKIQSGMSGQIKGLKEYGLNLSVAQLKETALAHGITLSTAKMTEAQKSMLRYVTIMEQSVNIQNDMARTIVTPANAMRIIEQQMTRLKRALGNIVSVLVTKFIPIMQAAIKLAVDFANKLAAAFGWTEKDLGWESVKDGIDYSDMLDDTISDTADTAEKLKKTLMGFDEINQLSSPDSAASNVLGGGLPPDFGLDMPEYDFLEGLDKSIDETENKLKEILSYVGAIGAGFAAWKISKALLNGVEWLKSNLKSENFTLGFSILGATKFLGDLKMFQEFLNDWLENGTSLYNVAGMIGEFAGLIGDAFLVLGETKTAGVFNTVQGIAEVISAISDISKNGVNWDNATLALRGLSNFAMGVSLLKGNFESAAVFGIFSGFTTVIRELKSVWEAIQTGDWSGVDKVALATGAIQSLGGIIAALKLIKKSNDAAKITETVPALKEVFQTTEELSNTTKELSGTTSSLSSATSSLTSKLSSLVKNLGLGLVVIAEVAAAAVLVVGAVWLLGKELEQVGIAWQPVIDNGKNVLTAIGLGTVVLAAVGVVTGLLGTAGTSLMVPLTAGIILMAEIGAATALFIGEILMVGEGLYEVAKAWQPVLDNGEIIKEAILSGTVLLIAVGTATAAIGMASVASFGLLPLAIAAGTALLVELAVSFVAFINSVESIANDLSFKLYPALTDLNSKLPALTDDMKNFTLFMEEFALQAANYSKSSLIIGFSTAVTAIINLFAKNPISSLADDVSKQFSQARGLNEKLRIANPELKVSINLINQYYTFLEEIERLTGKSNNISLAKGMFVSMKEVGTNLVTGFVAGIDAKNATLSRAVKSVLEDSLKSSTAYDYGYDFGQVIASGISKGIKNSNFPELRSYITTSSGGLANIRIKAYASGGFPDAGGLFIAREAGPELVGSIGNKTAVVNNDQIVASVEGGVYRAMRAAMQEGGAGTGSAVIVLNAYLDGEKVYQNTVEHHNSEVRKTGRSALLSGE